MGKFNDLPKEIMFEILTRLPSEQVLECKLVCKRWRDVVRLPYFSQLHFNRHLDSYEDSCKLSFIIVSHNNGIPNFWYTEFDENCHETSFSRRTRMEVDLPFGDYYFARSCNGLLCFDSWYFNCGQGPAYICNPITREYVMLPKSKESCWWTGFGYIPSTNEYKVVRIYESGGESNVGIIQVYTLGSGIGWRNAGTMDVNMKHVIRYSGVLVNGALHWENHHKGTIIAFHLNDEKVSELPAPPCGVRDNCLPLSRISLGVLGNSLSFTYYHFGGGAHIWLLKKNKDNCDLSWSREFSLDSEILQPFGFTESGRLLCCAFGNSKIYSCDPKASSGRMDVSFGKSITEAIPHKNTLVSLKVLGEKDTKTMESFKEQFQAWRQKTMIN